MFRAHFRLFLGFPEVGYRVACGAIKVGWFRRVEGRWDASA